MSLETTKAYHLNVPPYLRNRPKPVVDHIMARLQVTELEQCKDQSRV